MGKRVSVMGFLVAGRYNAVSVKCMCCSQQQYAKCTTLDGMLQYLGGTILRKLGIHGDLLTWPATIA